MVKFLKKSGAEYLRKSGAECSSILSILNHFSKPTARRSEYKIHLCLSQVYSSVHLQYRICGGTRWLICLVLPLICRYRIPCSNLGFWEQQTWKFFPFCLRRWNINRLTGPYPFVVPCGIVDMDQNRIVHHDICIVSEFSLSAPLFWRFPINAKNEIKDKYPSQHLVGMV